MPLGTSGPVFIHRHAPYPPNVTPRCYLWWDGQQNLHSEPPRPNERGKGGGRASPARPAPPWPPPSTPDGSPTTPPQPSRDPTAPCPDSAAPRDPSIVSRSCSPTRWERSSTPSWSAHTPPSTAESRARKARPTWRVPTPGPPRTPMPQGHALRRKERTSSIGPWTCALNSTNSSTGTHSSTMVRPPAPRTGYHDRNRVCAGAGDVPLPLSCQIPLSSDPDGVVLVQNGVKNGLLGQPRRPLPPTGIPDQREFRGPVERHKVVVSTITLPFTGRSPHEYGQPVPVCTPGFYRLGRKFGSAGGNT